MAGNYLADAMTSGPTKSIHAGVNAVIATRTLTTMSSSGSTTLQLMPIPAGAQMLDVAVHLSNTIGSGGETLSVYTTIGGNKTDILIPSSAHTTTMRTSGTETVGIRHSASAILTLQFGEVEGTGTSTVAIRAVATYLAELRGD